MIRGLHVLFEGAPIKISPARVGLLQILVDANGPVRCAELARDGWEPNPRRTGEDNVRRHVGLLREEIRAGVPGLEFDPIAAEGLGYELRLR